MTEQRRGCVCATSLLFISTLSVIILKFPSKHEQIFHKDILLTASTASSFFNGADGIDSSYHFGSVDARFEPNDYSDLDTSNIDDSTLGALHLDPSNLGLSNLAEPDLAQDFDLKKSSDSTVADLSNFFLENPSANDNNFLRSTTPADKYLATAVDSTTPARVHVLENQGMTLYFASHITTITGCKTCR